VDLGKFDRVLMNPPFQNADDIKHIQHAISFLNPGGVLVAICANGPRQQEKLKPLAESWEVLPAGTFAGTGVNAALLVIRKDEAQ
jgi:16S rRNA G1207 methylase RsmC